MSTRREVLKLLSVVAGVVFALPGALEAATKLAIPLDKVDKLQKVGGAIYLKIKGQDILFIRTAEDKISVLSPICTHKHCTVEYNPDEKLIICPCHGSTYDLNGKVLKGPAKKDLTNFQGTLSEGRIIFTLED